MPFSLKKSQVTYYHKSLKGEYIGGDIKYEADASWLSLPWLPWDGIAPAPTMLIFRHPEKVVASFLGIGFFDLDPAPGHEPYLEVARMFTPETFEISDPFERACHWYCITNRWALR